MAKILELRPKWLLIIFVLLDTLCIGMGMGVPFFCILFGFVVGWFLVRFITHTVSDVQQILRRILKYGSITAGFTLLAMLALWGPFTSYLFDPAKEIANSGIPMILYEPQASFIGWIVLIVLISPFLQLLTTLFGAYLVLLGWMKKSAYDQKAV